MAYNNYYQPMYYQPQPQFQVQSARIWVASLNEAQMYPVAPNNSVDLWDSNAPVIYSKQADAIGRPSMKIYDLSERVETTTAKDDKLPAYATKSELEAFSASLEAVKNDIETIRGDIYGIAGKRKKRAEDEE